MKTCGTTPYQHQHINADVVTQIVGWGNRRRVVVEYVMLDRGRRRDLAGRRQLHISWLSKPCLEGSLGRATIVTRSLDDARQRDKSLKEILIE